MHRLLSLFPLVLTLAAIALALAALVAAPAPDAVAVNATLAFAPPSSTVALNANDPVDITVANVTNLGGYDLSLSWNPAVVQLTSLSDANIWAGHSNIVICDSPSINNTAGTASMGCATFQGFGYNPLDGVTTTNALPLVHAVFKGAGPGTTSLNLSGSALQHPDATAITPVTLNTGSITVTASAAVGGVSFEPDREALRAANPSRADEGSLDARRWGGLTLVLSAAGAAALITVRRRRPG